MDNLLSSEKQERECCWIFLFFYLITLSGQVEKRWHCQTWSVTLDQLASWQSARYAQIPAPALIASWNTTIQFSSQFVPPSNLLLCSISLLFWQTESAPFMLAISRHLRKVSTTTLMTAAVFGSGWEPGIRRDLGNNTNIDNSGVRRKTGLRLSKMSPN